MNRLLICLNDSVHLLLLPNKGLKLYIFLYNKFVNIILLHFRKPHFLNLIFDYLFCYCYVINFVLTKFPIFLWERLSNTKTNLEKCKSNLENILKMPYKPGKDLEFGIRISVATLISQMVFPECPVITKLST